MLTHHKFGLCFLLFVLGCAEAGGAPGTTAAGSGGTAGEAGGASLGGATSGGSGGSGITAGAGGEAGSPIEDPCADGGCEQSECEVIEGFESEWPHLPWMATGWGVQGSGAQAAHDGAMGLVASEWEINQFVQVGLPGDRLTAWVRGTAGRAYLGFGSTPKGTKALVFAPNAYSILLDDCPGFYEFNDVVTQPTTLYASSWHKLEIEFGTGGQITGRLYGPDGGVVTTLTHTFPDLVPSGIAVRAFSDTYIDTIELCRK